MSSFNHVNPPVEALGGFEFSPPLNDACQYSTLYRNDKPVCTLQRRRVMERGPSWRLYATDGALIGNRCSYLGTYRAVAWWAVRQYSAFIGE